VRWSRLRAQCLAATTQNAEQARCPRGRVELQELLKILHRASVSSRLRRMNVEGPQNGWLLGEINRRRSTALMILEIWLWHNYSLTVARTHSAISEGCEYHRFGVVGDGCGVAVGVPEMKKATPRKSMEPNHARGTGRLPTAPEHCHSRPTQKARAS